MPRNIRPSCASPPTILRPPALYSSESASSPLPRAYSFVSAPTKNKSRLHAGRGMEGRRPLEAATTTTAATAADPWRIPKAPLFIYWRSIAAHIRTLILSCTNLSGCCPGVGSSSGQLKGNKTATCYKTKVVNNWDAINTIYSIGHANDEGAKTGAEAAQDSPEQADDASPDLPQKRQQTGDAILCMLGDMKTSFDDALKSTEPLPLPHVTPPAEILASLQMIPNFARCDMLKFYGKLILNERLFQAPMKFPMDMRKEWLLMLNEKNSN
ncbi:uncharacterized protein C2845_PM14G10560 [Panicum miliaceum]|uniref:Uncharacterized protein n=1 Tax=Panicum miliaceum TaxID=4540 RepID=A0A3L6PUF6_PANMI|nr:uncharacterized protein C2845_PM14G10560 [Panicum miliaceum]